MSGLFGYVRISVPIVTIWCPTIGSMPRTFSPRRCGGGHRTWFLAVFGLPIEIEGMDFLAYNAGAKPLKPLCIGPAGIIPPHLYSIWMARPPVAAPCTPRARSTRRPGAQRQAMAGRDHIGPDRRRGAPAGRAAPPGLDGLVTPRRPDARCATCFAMDEEDRVGNGPSPFRFHRSKPMMFWKDQLSSE